MTLPHENKESGGSQSQAKESQAKPEDDKVEQAADVKAADDGEGGGDADPADAE